MAIPNRSSNKRARAGPTPRAYWMEDPKPAGLPCESPARAVCAVTAGSRSPRRDDPGTAGGCSTTPCDGLSLRMTAMAPAFCVELHDRPEGVLGRIRTTAEAFLRRPRCPCSRPCGTLFRGWWKRRRLDGASLCGVRQVAEHRVSRQSLASQDQAAISAQLAADPRRHRRRAAAGARLHRLREGRESEAERLIPEPPAAPT